MLSSISVKKPFAIANAVKPSKSRITLAESEDFKPPSYAQIHSLERQITALKSEILINQSRYEKVLENYKDERIKRVEAERQLSLRSGPL